MCGKDPDQGGDHFLAEEVVSILGRAKRSFGSEDQALPVAGNKMVEVANLQDDVEYAAKDINEPALVPAKMD